MAAFTPPPSPRCHSLTRNFILMSVAFAVNISCVISCLSYATAVLGHLLGGYGGGVLYVFSATTALFCSNPLTHTLGPKSSLLFGMGFYCVYVSGFLLAVIVHHKFPLVAWVSFLTGSMFGGIASGVVWTAQGRYFSLHTQAYANEVSECGISAETVTNRFAGMFACIFLGMECILRAFASAFFLGLPSAATYDVVFSVYGSLTALSFFLMLRVDNMGDTGSRVLDTTAILKESTSAVSLVYSDVRLLLIIPFQLCVGLAFSFVPFYVFGTIIADSDNLGSAYVGLISATIPLTGSAMAFPTAAVASKYGKVLPMTIGAIGLGMAGLAVIIFSDETLGTWEFVMVYIVVYGIGRGVYENTNKAVVVDFFSHGRNTCSDAKRGDITAAFAATNFARNIASAFGYFAFNHISRLEMSLLVFVFAIVGLLCYYAAHLTNQSQLALQSQSEHSSHHASPLLSSNQESSSTTHHASGQVDQ